MSTVGIDELRNMRDAERTPEQRRQVRAASQNPEGLQTRDALKAAGWTCAAVGMRDRPWIDPATGLRYTLTQAAKIASGGGSSRASELVAAGWKFNRNAPKTWAWSHPDFGAPKSLSGAYAAMERANAKR